MENKSYQLRYLPIFETDLLSTVNYITNVLKNEDAAHRLVDDIESAILKRLENPLAFEPYRSAKRREYPLHLHHVAEHLDAMHLMCRHTQNGTEYPEKKL